MLPNLSCLKANVENVNSHFSIVYILLYYVHSSDLKLTVMSENNIINSKGLIMWLGFSTNLTQLFILFNLLIKLRSQIYNQSYTM